MLRAIRHIISKIYILTYFPSLLFRLIFLYIKICMYIHVLIYILYYRFINVKVRDINNILLNEISTV